jgi:peptidoglycan/LPS O-acetylase OafA/YrhL
MNNIVLKRLPGLDGLRGLLAIGVALSHSYSHFTGWHTGYDIFHNPDYAVDIFFILSGIVLYHSYCEKIKNKSITPGGFILTRFFRLYPLHIIAVILIPISLYISNGVFFPEWVGQITPTNLIGDLTLTNSLGIGFIPKTNIPSWSISVEMFAGTTVLLLSCTKRYIPWLLLIAGAVLSLYLQMDVKGASQAKIPLLSDGVLRCIYCMSAGICAYITVMKFRGFIKKYESFFIWFVSVSLMFMMIVLFGLNLIPSIYLPLTFIVAFAIATLPLLNFDITKFLESKTLVYLGNTSFSVYIMHTPVIYLMLGFKSQNLYENVFFATLAVGITVYISKLTLKYIELPLYNYGKSLINRKVAKTCPDNDKSPA